MHDTDWELIQACRRGRPRAWERVIDKYERLVFSVALKQGLTAEDAADISQITFTILLQSLDAFDKEVRLGGWLATVARRHAWRRRERRRREGPAPDADLSETLSWEEDERAERPLHQWERIEWLESGLAQLDERCRRLLLALYFDAAQPSYAEVAAQMGLAEGSIGPTRARCLQKLRAVLTFAEDE